MMNRHTENPQLRIRNVQNPSLVCKSLTPNPPASVGVAGRVAVSLTAASYSKVSRFRRQSRGQTTPAMNQPRG
jgi:hypothetical protein